jgi:TatD DNase family protein
MMEKSPRGFDFHCHLDLYPDPLAMLTSCAENRIVTLAVTTTPKAWPQNRKWAAGNAYVLTAVGLHPEVVGDRHGELTLLEEYMKDSPLVGEIGLDGSPKYKSSWNGQVEVFGRALATAQRLGRRVVSVHSRRAANEVVKCLEERITADRVLPILHWFSGSIGAARKAAELGCYFSINRRSFERDAGLALVRSLPADRLLTETDGPFTAVGSRKSAPPDVIETAKEMAEVRGASAAEMAQTIVANAARVLEFAGLKMPVDTAGT